MSTPALHGKHILVTQADVFMGPALCAVLEEQGATVIGDTRSMLEPEAAAALAAAGSVDVLVVHPAVPAPGTPANEVSDGEWSDMFSAMVHPLQRLVRAALPPTMARRLLPQAACDCSQARGEWPVSCVNARDSDDAVAYPSASAMNLTARPSRSILQASATRQRAR